MDIHNVLSARTSWLLLIMNSFCLREISTAFSLKDTFPLAVSTDFKQVSSVHSTSPRYMRMAFKISAFIGKRAEIALLENTKLIFSKGSNRVYTKYGTYEDALQDFLSVQPIIRVNDLGSQIWGVVGDRKICSEMELGRVTPASLCSGTRLKEKRTKSKRKKSGIRLYIKRKTKLLTPFEPRHDRHAFGVPTRSDTNRALSKVSK